MLCTVNVKIFVSNKFRKEAIACTYNIFAWNIFHAVHPMQTYLHNGFSGNMAAQHSVAC